MRIPKGIQTRLFRKRHRTRAQYFDPKHTHPGTSSPQVSNHHRNWRLKAIQSLEKDPKNNLHYSAAITLSRDDVVLLKEKTIENLKDLNKTIHASKEEEVFAMTFDLFNLG